MATLANNTIASTYPLLLKVNSNGIDGALRTIEDGDATSTALQLSTAGIKSTGTLEIAGASTLTGAVQLNNTLTIGANDTGYDVIFYGATSGAYMKWDQANDQLELIGNTDAGSRLIITGAQDPAMSITSSDPGSSIDIRDNNSSNMAGIASYGASGSTNDRLELKTNNIVRLTVNETTTTVAGDLTVTGNDILYGAASAGTLKMLAASGTDTVGGALTIASGQGTGTGAGGNIAFQVAETGGGSGSGVNSLATVMTISGGAAGSHFGKIDFEASALEFTSDSGTEIQFTAADQVANIYSAGNMLIKAEASKQISLGTNNQTDTVVIDSSENVTLQGSLQVGGNIIKASDGGSTITMDTSDNVTIAGSLAVEGAILSMASGGIMSPIATAHNVAGAPMLISAGDTTSGTTNDIAGGTLTIEGGKGKGTGVGGNILFKVAEPAVGTANTMNALATALTISGTTGDITAAGTVNAAAFASNTYNNSGASDLLITSSQDVIIRVDDDQGVGAGAQKFKVKNGADSVVSEMNESGDLTIQGTFLENRTTIKIPPTAFVCNEGGSLDLNYAIIEDSTAVKGLRVASADCELYAYIDVPTGYTATKVRVNGSDDAMDIEVYTLDLDAGTISAEISNSGLQTNDNTALASNHVGADDKMLFIKIVTTAVDDVVWGGYVTIQQT